jgi:eukaryotic-like serine/threonine-protein kinase
MFGRGFNPSEQTLRTSPRPNNKNRFQFLFRVEFLMNKKPSTVIASPIFSGAKQSLIVYLSFLILLLGISCASPLQFDKVNSSDISNWNSFRKDCQNTAYDPSPIETPNKLLWKYDTKKALKSSPIIMNKVVVIGSSDKRVFFINALSGKNLSVQKVYSSVSTSACGDDATVYFGLDRGKETFFAQNLKTGKILWEKKLGDLSSSPALSGDKIFVGVSNGTLWALNKITGEKIWEFNTKYTIFSTPACNSSSSSVMDEEIIYFGSTDGYLYALSSDSGSVKWKFKADGGIYSSPAIKNGMIFFGSVDGCLYALNLMDSSLVWKFQTQADIYSSPAVTESLVYIGSNDYNMYAVNQQTGELIWKFKTEGLVHSSPIAVGDKLFFGSYDGNFYVLNRFTGKLLWKYQTKGMISSSPAYYDGKIYIASEDGFLYCFGL